MSDDDAKTFMSSNVVIPVGDHSRKPVKRIKKSKPKLRSVK
jgi:hypothetical protein